MKTNEIEMKEKNEQILNTWRKIGFLQGLKEGSINEWRCAKSFDEMVNYCLNNKGNTNPVFETIIFPIIRRVLCTGKNRISRIIHPEELINSIKETTIKEALDIVDISLPLKGTNGLKSVVRRLMRNFCEKILEPNLSCFDLIASYDNFEKEIDFFQKITGCDFEVEWCCVCTEVIKYKFKGNDIFAD